MRTCVKVRFETNDAAKTLKKFVAEQAKAFSIEGVGQETGKTNVQLLVCGEQDNVDDFVDALYLGSSSIKLYNIEVESCMSDRSFRGVFRIVA